MLFKNFRIFLLCSLSVFLLFSCSTEFGDSDLEDREATIREYEDAFATSKDSCKPKSVDGSTYHSQKLDLTGKDLKKQPGESVEDFLARLGFTADLCEGTCDTGGEDCTVTNVFNSVNSDLGGIHGSGHSKIIRKFYPKSKNQDMTCVNVVLRAICKCK